MFFTSYSVSMKYLELIFGQDVASGNISTAHSKWKRSIGTKIPEEFLTDKAQGYQLQLRSYLKKQLTILSSLSKQLEGEYHNLLKLDSKASQKNNYYSTTVSILTKLFTIIKKIINNSDAFSIALKKRNLISFKNKGAMIIQNLAELSDILNKSRPRIRELIDMFKSEFEIYQRVEEELIEIESELMNI